MKCQIMFSVKNKKYIINLSSAELAQRVVKIKLGSSDFIVDHFLLQFLFSCSFFLYPTTR